MVATPTLVEGPLHGQALDQAVDVAVRAFGDDPFFRWMFPESHFDEALGRIHRAVLVQVASLAVTRSAVLDGRVVGVALWIPPGSWPYPPGVQLRQLLSGIRAFLPELWRLPRAGRVLRSVELAHPKVPAHWYLQLLMVDPDVQRQGIGGMLQAPELAACDEDAIPAWVETQKDENVAYYGRFGFELVKEHRPYPECPAMYSMRREPRG